MNRENIKLSQLRCLVAIAQLGNFSEASLHLGISQPAVSHAVAGLEDELGVILFARGRHGARLTPVGERMLHYANQILQLVDQMDQEAALTKGLEGGSVRIGSLRSFATRVLPEVLADFCNAYPAIAISVTEYRGDNRLEQALRSGEIDLGFTCLPPAADFSSYDIIRDEYIALFPPHLEVANPITWEDLASNPMIFPPDTDYCAGIIQNYLTQLKQNIVPSYKIAEDSTIIDMVLRGFGITIISRLSAEPLPTHFQIRQLPAPLERTIRVLTLADALHPPAVFAFLDTLKTVIQRNETTVSNYCYG